MRPTRTARAPFSDTRHSTALVKRGAGYLPHPWFGLFSCVGFRVPDLRPQNFSQVNFKQAGRTPTTYHPASQGPSSLSSCV